MKLRGFLRRDRRTPVQGTVCKEQCHLQCFPSVPSSAVTCLHGDVVFRGRLNQVSGSYTGPEALPVWPLTTHTYSCDSGKGHPTGIRVWPWAQVQPQAVKCPACLLLACRVRMTGRHSPGGGRCRHVAQWLVTCRGCPSAGCRARTLIAAPTLSFFEEQFVD